MTDDFIRFGTLGGAYAGNPNQIAELFEEGSLKEKIDKPLILTYLNGREEKWPKALDYIKYYIDLFRQWAYCQADGDKELLQEIDDYINGLYELLKQGRERDQLDNIELTRLKAQKESLNDKLNNYIPERLIAGGQASIGQMLDDIQNYEYVTDYPGGSFKWQNGEIERLGLISEKIELLRRLIEKLYPENAAKYHYLHHLQKIVFDISSYTGVLERSRDELDWSIIDNEIEEYKRRFYRQHLPELKELRREELQADKTDLENIQEIISSLRRHKESGGISARDNGIYYSDNELWEESEKIKASFPPIRSVYKLLYKYKDLCTEKTVDVIIQLGRAVRNEAGYYSELLDKLSSNEFLKDLKKVKTNIQVGTEGDVEEDYKLETLSKSIENAKSRGYKDDLYQLEIQLSTFIVPSYSDFVNSLDIAFKELQKYCDDFDIYDTNNYVSGFLFDENHEYQFSRKLFQIQESISIITKTTPKALPVLRSHFDQLTNNIIAAIFEAGHNKMPEYYPMNTIGRAWDNMKHFYKLTQNELSSLMKLTDEIIPDYNAVSGMAEMLAEKYEKWASVDTLKQPNGYTWMSFRRAVICDESYKNLYKEVMNYLLCTKNIDSIDKIRRIHGELWEIIINTPHHFESVNDIVLIENIEMKDKAKQLAASIRDAIRSIKPAEIRQNIKPTKEPLSLPLKCLSARPCDFQTIHDARKKCWDDFRAQSNFSIQARQMTDALKACFREELDKIPSLDPDKQENLISDVDKYIQSLFKWLEDGKGEDHLDFVRRERLTSEHTSLVDRLRYLLQLAETDQGVKPKGSKERDKPGPKPKYTPELIEKLKATFEKFEKEGKGKKYAYFQTSKEHKIKSPDAVKMALHRHSK